MAHGVVTSQAQLKWHSTHTHRLALALSLYLFTNFSLFLQPLEITFFTVCISLTLFLIYSLSDTMHYLSFSAWRISLSTASSRSIHVVPPHGISFSHAWVRCHCIHSSINGHLGCCHILALVDYAAMNTGAWIYLWYPLSFPLAMYSEEELLDPMMVL